MTIEERRDWAVTAINTERKRQTEKEGWTPEHDDQHKDGELLTAGMVYLWHGTDRACPLRDDGCPIIWPWDAEWFKPKDRRQNLVRAGGLMLAEKERLHRRYPQLTSFSHVDHKINIVLRQLTALDAATKEETE